MAAWMDNTLALSHSVFFSSVVMRTLATVFSDLLGFPLVNISHIFSVCIWLSATYTTCFLIKEILQNGLLNSVYHTFSKCSFGRVVPGGLMLAMILHYEVWMFHYIYKTYVVAFDWTTDKVLIVMATPFFTLLMHTTLQLFFLLYGNCIRSCSEIQYTYFKYYIHASIFFNATMIFHVVTMGIISYSKGSTEDADTPTIVFFAILELFYRCYAIYIHVRLLGIHHNLPRQVIVAPIPDTTDRPCQEMVVTTSRLSTITSPYWIIPIIAVSISSLGVAMVIEKTKINL